MLFSSFGRARTVVAVLAAIMASASVARGQAASPIVPPALEGSPEVPYPAGATGDASVVLEIVVEKDGTVSRADIVSGEPPFVEAAQRAVREWRFAPARRGGIPISVRTRAIVGFHQHVEDEPASSAVPSPHSPAPSPATAPAAPRVEEVKVLGRRREIGQLTLSASDVREMPGAFGDPFRAIDALPGVAPILSGLPYFFIRGAPPNNTGYFLDGVRIPLLFHVGLGPGVIHPELVDRVDLFSGAAPADYGRFAGAIVAAQTRAPSATFRGTANVRLVDAGALVESPFADGRGNALVAARYGYPGPILSVFSNTKMSYWDYQSRIAWKLGERDTLSVFAFGSHDLIAHTEERTGVTAEDFVSDFHRIDLRYDHVSAEGRARVGATFGYDGQGVSPTYLTNMSGAIRAELERNLTSSLRVRSGADARIDHYGFEKGVPADLRDAIVPSGVDPPPTNIAWGGHADVVWRLTPRVELVPGVRVDVYEASRHEAGAVDPTHRRVPAIDPRLASRLTLTPSIALVSSLGLAHQYPTLRVGELPAAIAAGMGFRIGSNRLQAVAQASQGVEVALPLDFTMTATAFLSGWTGLTDLSSGCVEIFPPGGDLPPASASGPPPNGPRRIDSPYVCPNEAPNHGRAYGAELLVRRPLSKRLSGWVSYTLSRSIRDTHFVRLDGSTAVATVPSEFDRTHVLNAILAYDLGRRWRVGGRFLLYSGAPYSRLSGNVPVPPYNAFRDPPFYRLDVRIEKRWPLGKNGSIAFVIEGQNVTLSKERTGLATDCIGPLSADGGTRCTRAEIGPITVPSVGVEAFF